MRHACLKNREPNREKERQIRKMREIPRPGEKYRHFKNRLYQIIALARHSETGEWMVIYQQLYGDNGVWARPLDMFLEPVDREKYPDAVQEWRFEKVGDPAGPEEENSGGTKPEILKAPEETAAESAGKEGEASRAAGEKETEENTAPMHPLLYDFLEAEKIDDRLAILRSMRGVVGRREVDSLYAALELKAVPGTVLEELDNLEEILLLKKRFDAGRLRRS